MPVPKFVIEPEVSGVGNLSDAQLREISQEAVDVLRAMGPEIECSIAKGLTVEKAHPCKKRKDGHHVFVLGHGKSKQARTVGHPPVYWPFVRDIWLL